MEANEKTFRHSRTKLVLMFLGVLFFGVFAVFAARQGGSFQILKRWHEKVSRST